MAVEQQFIHFLDHYGNIGLFGLLALGIFGLPIPDETLLVIAGFLVAKGHLSPVMTPIMAFAGGAFGITLSYLFGYTAGKSVMYRYGGWVGITKSKIERAHSWFEWVGKWLLLIGFYIPGLRHLTGFIAGTVYLSYWHFAIFAYIGAFIWSMSFLAAGYFFYNWWELH